MPNENIPKEIKKWNWGAFFLNWLWGLGNRTYIAFLVFAPIVGFFIPFALGFRGNEWAWKNKEWDSVEEFNRIQKKWSRAGIIFGVLTIILIPLIVVFLLFSNMAKMAPVEDTLTIVNNHPQSQEILGTPIKRGFWLAGTVATEGPSGHADVAIPVKGKK